MGDEGAERRIGCKAAGRAVLPRRTVRCSFAGRAPAAASRWPEQLRRREHYKRMAMPVARLGRAGSGPSNHLLVLHKLRVQLRYLLVQRAPALVELRRMRARGGAGGERPSGRCPRWSPCRENNRPKALKLKMHGCMACDIYESAPHAGTEPRQVKTEQFIYLFIEQAKANASVGHARYPQHPRGSAREASPLPVQTSDACQQNQLQFLYSF